MTDHICPPEHKHGATGNCYNDHKCRCRPCKDSRAAHARDVVRRKAYGTYDSGFVDATPVKEHVAQLRAAGLGRRRIAELADIHYSVIEALIYYRRTGSGKRQLLPTVRIARHNAEKILAVHASTELLAGNALLSAKGAHRRLQALIACGWSGYKLTALLGKPAKWGTVAVILNQKLITAAMHQRVAALYESLWNVEPPHTDPHDKSAYARSINRARTAHWAKPLAWDDIDTDAAPASVEYDHTVDDIAVELACSGEKVRLNSAERREVVRILHPRKWSDNLVAAHADCDERTVLRIRQELGLPGWDQTELVQKRAA